MSKKSVHSAHYSVQPGMAALPPSSRAIAAVHEHTGVRCMASNWVDGFGRTIDYVRMSVTDRCDFRCIYCMSEDMTFLPREQVLTLEEIFRSAQLFVANGVTKIRLTGGEPLVRKGVVGLCENISALPGLRELVMTTNGSQLTRYARPLADAGIKRLNISLDTLDP